MADSVLKIHGASKCFGDTQALRGVDLELHKGEWLGLLGPNGAGKTTIVRAIHGRCRLDAGTVRLFGEPPASTERARLGVVPQEIALYPLLTARENLEAFGSLSGVPAGDVRARAAWALSVTGLEDRADDLVRGFSGGMKRRLNLGCSVLHRPEVILLDEPTVGVDPQSRERIWEVLQSLRDEGASILLTTHQLDEAQTVCERLVIIDHGRVVAEGTLDELIARTVGEERQVTLLLDGPPGPLGPFDGGLAAKANGHSVTCSVGDVASALPDLLVGVQRSGRRVRDIQVQAPTLQAVFLHLTGRELRE